jgi:HTH domain.
MKTIKQIADELGVSRQAVHKRMKQEPLSTSLQGLTSTVDGKFTVAVDGEMLIRQAFTRHNASTKSSTVDVNQNNQVDTLISMLQRELDAKNTQLAAKDEQIENLTSALEHTTASLHAAQALHAGTMQQQLTDSEHSDEGVKKKGFFSLFRK